MFEMNKITITNRISIATKKSILQIKSKSKSNSGMAVTLKDLSM